MNFQTMNSVSRTTSNLPENWPVQVLYAYSKFETYVGLPVPSKSSDGVETDVMVAGAFGWLTKQMRSDLGKFFAKKRRRTKEGRFAKEGPLGSTELGEPIRARMGPKPSVPPAPRSEPLDKYKPPTIGPNRVLTDNVTINGDMTDAMQKLLDDLSYVPEDLQRMIRDAGAKVFITDGPISDFAPERRGVVPRGWEGTGRTLDDVAGGYFVGERTAVMGSADRGHGSVSLALHEYGHAVDENFRPGRALSSSPEFRELSSQVNWRNSYFSQPGEAGASEAFAEIFAAIKLTDDERSDYFRAITKDEKSAELVEEMFQSTMETLKTGPDTDTPRANIPQENSEEIYPSPYGYDPYYDPYSEEEEDGGGYSGWITDSGPAAEEPETSGRTRDETTALTSSDPQERSRAVGRITNQEVLHEVAKEDDNQNVVFNAVLKLTDPEALKDVAFNSQFDRVRAYAFHKLGDESLLPEYLEKEKVEANIDSALNKVKDQSTLKNVIDTSENRLLKMKAASLITDQDILRDILLNEADPSVRQQAAINTKNPDLINEVLEKETDKFVRGSLLENIQTIDALSDVEAEQVAAMTKNKDLLMQAVNHPSPAVRIAALQNKETPEAAIAAVIDDPATNVRVHAALHRNTTPEMLEALAKDPERDVRAATALNRDNSPENLEILANDPEEVVRIAAKARQQIKEQKGKVKNQFSMTKQQIADGVQSLSPSDQSAPRNPSLTDDPSVVAAGLMEFFNPDVTGITAEELEELRTFGEATEDISQIMDKTLKGLVAERITDKLKDVPLEDLLSLVSDASKAMGAEGINISSYNGTGKNRTIEDVVAGVGSTLVSDVLPASEGKERRYSPSEIMKLLQAGDGRTMLVLDRAPRSHLIADQLKIVRFAEGEAPTPGAGFASSALLGTPEAETVIRDHLAAHMVMWWAQSANDEHAGSLAVQERAGKLFNPQGGAVQTEWKMKQGLADAVAEISSKHGEVIDRFLQAQYDQTQEMFAALGIKEIAAYRGVVDVLDDDGKSLTILNGSPDQSGPSEPIEVAELARLLPRPLSAWSHSERIAEAFADTLGWEGPARERTPDRDYQYTATTRIPVENIVSTPLSGNGSLPDKEYVVIGTNNEAFVVNESKVRGTQGASRSAIADQMKDVQSEPPKTISVDSGDTNADWSKTILRKEAAKDSVQEEVEKLEAAETGGKMTTTSEKILSVFESELNAGRSTVVQMFMALPPELRQEFYQAMSRKRGKSSPKNIAAQLKAILREATPQQREQYAKQREALAKRKV